MADFRGTILTQKGLNLLAKAQAGATLTFTKIKLGDGLWATGTDPYQLNEIISPKMNLPIQHIEVAGDGTVRLRFVLTNIGLTQGFFMREIGIYAQDPDFGEILYAVAYAADRSDFIPSDGTTKVENVVDIYTVIANAQNVTAVISDTVLLATKQDVDKVKSEAGATAPLLTYAGKLWVNTNENNFLKYFDGSNWQNVKVPFADTVDGFHASQTPAPNVIVPLNENARIYNYVAKGDLLFDPPDFIMSNSTEYFIGSTDITTPSWSPSGAWKIIFVLYSYLINTSSGFNDFAHVIKYDTNSISGAAWLWNTPMSYLGIGFADTILTSELPNGITKTFNFYVYQGGGNVNAKFYNMRVQWYLIP